MIPRASWLARLCELLVQLRLPASVNKMGEQWTPDMSLHTHKHRNKCAAATTQAHIYTCTQKKKVFFLQKFFAYPFSSCPFRAIQIISISGSNLVYCKKNSGMKNLHTLSPKQPGNSQQDLWCSKRQKYYWFIYLLNTQHKGKKGLLTLHSKLTEFQRKFMMHIRITKHLKPETMQNRSWVAMHPTQPQLGKIGQS